MSGAAPGPRRRPCARIVFCVAAGRLVSGPVLAGSPLVAASIGRRSVSPAAASSTLSGTSRFGPARVPHET